MKENVKNHPPSKRTKIKGLIVDERITTITGIAILTALWVIWYMGIITIDVCISTSVFPAGLIFSKDKWLGFKTK